MSKDDKTFSAAREVGGGIAERLSLLRESQMKMQKQETEVGSLLYNVKGGGRLAKDVVSASVAAPDPTELPVASPDLKILNEDSKVLDRDFIQDSVALLLTALKIGQGLNPQIPVMLVEAIISGDVKSEEFVGKVGIALASSLSGVEPEALSVLSGVLTNGLQAIAEGDPISEWLEKSIDVVEAVTSSLEPEARRPDSPAPSDAETESLNDVEEFDGRDADGETIVSEADSERSGDEPVADDIDAAAEEAVLPEADGERSGEEPVADDIDASIIADEEEKKAAEEAIVPEAKVDEVTAIPSTPAKPIATKPEAASPKSVTTRSETVDHKKSSDAAKKTAATKAGIEVVAAVVTSYIKDFRSIGVGGLGTNRIGNFYITTENKGANPDGSSSYFLRTSRMGETEIKALNEFQEKSGRAVTVTVDVGRQGALVTVAAGTTNHQLYDFADRAIREELGRKAEARSVPKDLGMKVSHVARLKAQRDKFKFTDTQIGS